MKLATMIPNIHYIGHPHFGHADVQKFEDLPEHCLLVRDGLHLSYKGMFHYIQYKIFFLIYVSVISCNLLYHAINGSHQILSPTILANFTLYIHIYTWNYTYIHLLHTLVFREHLISYIFLVFKSNFKEFWCQVGDNMEAILDRI